MPSALAPVLFRYRIHVIIILMHLLQINALNLALKFFRVTTSYLFDAGDLCLLLATQVGLNGQWQALLLRLLHLLAEVMPMHVDVLSQKA